MTVGPLFFAPSGGGGGGGGGGEGSFSAGVLALSPWGYWKLDETGTLSTATDSSGNARNGTYLGSFAGGSAGIFQGSSSSVFTATTGYITLPALTLAESQKFTLMVAIKTSATSTRQLISADNSSGSNRVWQWRLSNGQMQVVPFGGAGSGAANAGGPTTLNDNAPHLLFMVVDPTLAVADGRIKFYVDGALAYSSTVDLTITPSGANAPVAIATRSTGTVGETYSGGMDEAAIFTTALTGAQVSSLWDARNTL